MPANDVLGFSCRAQPGQAATPCWAASIAFFHRSRRSQHEHLLNKDAVEGAVSEVCSYHTVW
jgi:hypothetical protein